MWPRQAADMGRLNVVGVLLQRLSSPIYAETLKAS
jgi:hypothetical protein